MQFKGKAENYEIKIALQSYAAYLRGIVDRPEVFGSGGVRLRELENSIESGKTP